MSRNYSPIICVGPGVDPGPCPVFGDTPVPRNSASQKRCPDCQVAYRKAYMQDPKFVEPSRAWHKSEAGRAWRHEQNKTPHVQNYHRVWWLQKKYGMTPEDYDRMVEEQGGRCGLCGTDKPGGRGVRWHIDHDHATGKVRALLCGLCNNGLGSFRDDPELMEKAAAYVRAHKAAANESMRKVSDG